ncbi:MFS transporter [Robbsia sp. KACC 23696]|uniref:MFS transporter n=1 Tax=Robbsia sp. KACC 23696 TaxID=3149231 RepID=UPI00325BBA49
MTPTHVKVVTLVAAGYCIDVMDYAIYGSFIPDMLRTHFATRAELGMVGGAQLLGLALGTFLQGQFTDRFGRKAVYQFNLLLFGLATIASALAPTVMWLVLARFVSGLGLGAEQPLAFTYAGEYAPKDIRGRILAIVHFIGGALVWPIAFLITLYFRESIGWRGIWGGIGVAALVLFVLRFALPESPRWLAAKGRGAEALAIIKKMGLGAPTETLSTAVSVTASDPFVFVWKHYRVRLLAAMVCFSAFFCVTIGLGTWLPNIMSSKGFTITKSLSYTFGMTLAAPCASLFMMYALDHFGRRRTAFITFVCSGVFAIAFASARSDVQLIAAGFMMIFFYQVGGNTMQIFASEVFPTQARASGFGMAAGIGRLATAGFVPALPMIQHAYGLTAVFACIAGLMAIAACGLPLIGPETRRRSLDDIASPRAEVATPKDVVHAYTDQHG